MPRKANHSANDVVPNMHTLNTPLVELGNRRRFFLLSPPMIADN